MDLLDVSSDTASKTKHFPTNFTCMLFDLGQIQVSLNQEISQFQLSNQIDSSQYTCLFDMFIQINLQIKGFATMLARFISLVFVDPNLMFS